ncbi:MAG: hypothetical protein V1906_03325 [Candidatus Woesearchaeota archaeon]
MDKFHIWLKSEVALDKDIKLYMTKEVITSVRNNLMVDGHLIKAKRNLEFASKIVNILKDYYDWSVVADYYAVYHSALSLCASKGYATHSHMATIALLIKHFYPRHIEIDDLNLISNHNLVESEMMGMIKLKDCREDATYSISQSYEVDTLDDLHDKATHFVGKVEAILKN